MHVEKNSGKEEVRATRHMFDSILNVLAWLSFILAVVLALAVFLSSFSGTENARSVFGYKMLIVESDSMSKSEISMDESIWFNEDDLIFIKKVDDVNNIKVGDVITFVSYNPGSTGKTLTHKVRSIKTTEHGEVLGFETYGINTGVSDQAVVHSSAIIGRYVGKSETLGRMFCYFKTPAGYFTSILTPCVLLIIFFSIKVGKILTKREMGGMYNQEVETLRNRIEELEKNKEGVLMQTDLREKESFNSKGEQTEQVSAGQATCVNVQTVPNAQPCAQTSSTSDRVLEIMATTLGKAVDSLTRTIDTIVASVGKPVDTLARSIETIATATSRPSVVEKIIEKPIVQTIIKDSPVERAKEKAVDEIAVTQVPVEKEPKTREQVVEISQVDDESDAGNKFSEFNQHEKVAFSKKLLSLDKEVKEYFGDVHNELVSFKKVNYRISFKGITYRVGRKTIAKMVVRGKTLKLHLALDVNGFSKTVFFQQDMSGVKAYEDVPFAVKVKSKRGKENAIKLVDSLADNNSLQKKDNAERENILSRIKEFK